MTLNPILARELRARWRDNRSFLLIFATSFLLAALTVWAYWSRIEWQHQIAEAQTFRGMVYWQGQWIPATVLKDLNSTMSDAGRAVFKALTLGQIAAWMLIAPAVAAPSIAGERERGLLEGLWLSRLSPLSLLAGRLLSSLALAAVLQVAALPFAAVCLVLGGVSPGEIGTALLFQAMAAMTGTCIGLCISARHPRPPGALTSALGAIILWSVIAYVARDFMNPTYLWGTTVTEDLSQIGYLLVASSHPAGGADAWLNGWFKTYSLLPDDTILLVNILFQASIWIVTLMLALRSIMLPLPEMTWMGRNPLVERYRRRLNTAAEARVAREAAKAGLRERAGRTLLFELPVHIFIRFRNPLLQREVRARFRFRRVPLMLSLLRTGLLLGAIATWVMAATTVTDPLSRRESHIMILFILGIGGVLGAAVFGSTAFSREKESGTWEGLRLALLTPREIVWAKWRSPLITLIYFLSPFWLLLPFCVSWLPRGAPPLEIALKGLVVLSVISATTAGALWFSWRCRNSTNASAWMLVTLLLLHVGASPANSWLGASERLTQAVTALTGKDFDHGDLGYGTSYSDWQGYQRSIEIGKAVFEAPLAIDSLLGWPPYYRMEQEEQPLSLPVLRNLCTVAFYGLVTLALCWHLRLMVEREVAERRPVRRLSFRRELAATPSAS